MSVTIGPGLELIQLPRRPDLGDYDWFDLERGGVQVGKARCRIEPGRRREPTWPTVFFGIYVISNSWHSIVCSLEKDSANSLPSLVF